MEKEEMAYIGCRLLALYYIVNALYAITTFTLFFTSWKRAQVKLTFPEASMVYYQLAPFVFYVIAGCVLWFGAGKIVNTLLPGSNIDNGLRSMTAFQVQSVIFSAIGILVLSLTIPDIVGALYTMTQWQNISTFSQVSLEFKTQAVELVIRMFVGVFLLFGSKGLSSLLVRVRAAKLN